MSDSVKGTILVVGIGMLLGWFVGHMVDHSTPVAQAERVEPRFSFDGYTQLGQFTQAYVVHDRTQPEHCVLVVAMSAGSQTLALTSQEWPCE